ncbi:DnaA ATPase domain-containing protein, partial [Aliarcobacter butzleri]|uniref:DnaA ATPase domain-containing protein n=1 Tax=Aliarcobacter butzleri TaxID=28197 RepID=UPI003AF91685
TILNPSYTFESFVVGPSNQMAYNASLAVATKPGIQYNPLSIYGGTGLGKTHLSQAVGNHAIVKGTTIIYVTIAQFINV